MNHEDSTLLRRVAADLFEAGIESLSPEIGLLLVRVRNGVRELIEARQDEAWGVDPADDKARTALAEYEDALDDVIAVAVYHQQHVITTLADLVERMRKAAT